MKDTNNNHPLVRGDKYFSTYGLVNLAYLYIQSKEADQLNQEDFCQAFYRRVMSEPSGMKWIGLPDSGFDNRLAELATISKTYLFVVTQSYGTNLQKKKLPPLVPKPPKTKIKRPPSPKNW